MSVDVFDVTVPLTATATLFIIIGGRQNYANITGSKPWTLHLYYDEMLVNVSGGSGAYTDTPTLFGTVVGASPGNHRVRVVWDGHQDITISGLNMLVQASYK